jgi:hypothetical protein
MNEPELRANDDSTQTDRPERWDDAVVAGYIYDLLKGSA